MIRHLALYQFGKFKRKIRLQSNFLFMPLVLLLGACQSMNLPVPDGFAKYRDNNKDLLRAVSPERVVYRVHTINDEPKADLAFWKTALETHFKKGGYIIVEQKPIKAASLPGYSFVVATTFAEKDYTYALNVFVVKQHVLLIEVGGENAYFEKYRQQIAAAIAASNFEASSSK